MPFIQIKIINNFIVYAAMQDVSISNHRESIVISHMQSFNYIAVFDYFLHIVYRKNNCSLLAASC